MRYKTLDTYSQMDNEKNFNGQTLSPYQYMKFRGSFSGKGLRDGFPVGDAEGGSDGLSDGKNSSVGFIVGLRMREYMDSVRSETYRALQTTGFGRFLPWSGRWPELMNIASRR